MNEDGLRALKMLGFSDARLAKLTGRDETDVRKARQNLGVVACFKRIDTWDRVRLLLRPRLLRPDQGRLRDHHDQLQP